MTNFYNVTKASKEDGSLEGFNNDLNGEKKKKKKKKNKKKTNKDGGADSQN